MSVPGTAGAIPRSKITEMARVRPHVPRTGRRRSFRPKKRKLLGKRSPKQLAAAVGRKRVRRTKRR